MHINTVTQTRPAKALVNTDFLSKISQTALTIVDVQSAIDTFKKE